MRSGAPNWHVDGAQQVSVAAPAKLTLSLRVVGTRDDGHHLLEAEMVTVDLADSLTFVRGVGLMIVDEIANGAGLRGLDAGPSNLVSRAMELVGRRSAIHLVKRIPVRGGLGGGSADAAAVLRWAGGQSAAVAARLGSDVPFCLVGGRARVGGTGEIVEPLPFEERTFLLLLPPIEVDTGAVYRAFDHLGRIPAGRHQSSNDLELAAISVAPELAHWRDSFGDATGRVPQLAGSGSTWFVEGSQEDLGLGDREFLVLGDQRAPLVSVGTIPPGTSPE